MFNIYTNFFLNLERLFHENLNQLINLRTNFKYKNDNSPVSSADIYCQNLIIKEIKKSFLDPIIISEELVTELNYFSKGKLLFVIDPIDGTENFISGIEIWGIAISIWEYPNHVFSMILLPELNKSIKSKQQILINKSRILGLSSSVNEDLIKEIVLNGENRIMGCSVYNFYNVIRGSFKSFSNPKGAYIWDMLAGVNLALEHGCKVTVEGKEYHGEFLDPNKRHRFKVSNE